MKQVFLTLFFYGILLGCKEKSSKIVTPTEPTFTKEAEGYLVKANGDTIHKLDIEIADDDFQRETGLMYRNSMADNQGMLFVFPSEEYRSFYMKNTRIPLDIIYLDENYKAVDFVENVSPMNEKSLPSQVPAQYVLEINGNLSEKLTFEIGDKLVLSDSKN